MILLFAFAVFLCVNIPISYAEEVRSKVTGTLIESDSTLPNEQNKGEDSDSNNAFLPQTGEQMRNRWFFTGGGLIMLVLIAGYYKVFVVTRGRKTTNDK